MANNVNDASSEYKRLEQVVKDLTKALEGGTKKVKKMDKAVTGGVTGVRNLRLQVKTLTDRVKEQNKEVPKGTTAWSKYGRQLSIVRSRMLIVAFAARTVQKAIGTLLELNQKQFISELKLESVLRSTGHAARMSGTELRNMATEMSKVSLISDDLIIDSQAIMLTFTQIGREVFPDAIKQAMNMSIIFGQDLKQSVIQVGKALNDPITGVGALRRIGVSFSETQKEQIKGFMETNDLASAQGVILEELAREMGGVAEKMNEAPLSDWQLGMMRLKDAGEGVGDAFNNLLGPVRALWLGVTRLVEAFDEFDKWYTGRGTQKEAEERAALIEAQTKAFRDQLRVMKEFQSAGVNSQFMAEMRGLNGLYRDGIIDAEEFVKRLEQQLNFAKKMAKEGGFVEPLSPEQVAENEKRLANLSKFMEKFRSKDLNDEMQFQLDKLKILDENMAGEQVIRDYYQKLKDDKDAADKEQERVRMQSHHDELQAQLTAFGTQLLNNKSNQLNLEMSQDIAFAKNSRAYKIAQKRGDNATMERLEKDAAKKTYDRRVKNFRANQLLAVANIVIDYTQAMSKEASTQGLLAFATAFPVFTAASIAAIATVLAQKPPAFARGGDFVTSGPQNIIVGDNPGGRERVQVTPLSSPNIAGPQGESSVTVNISGNVMSKDYVEGELAEQIRDAVRRGEDFGIS